MTSKFICNVMRFHVSFESVWRKSEEWISDAY